MTPLTSSATNANHRYTARTHEALMPNVPRGKNIGKPLGDPPKDEAEHSSAVVLAAAGSIVAISARVLTHTNDLSHSAEDQPQ
jgi:hypothetical protein